jgi:hypothetical protein
MSMRRSAITEVEDIGELLETSRRLSGFNEHCTIINGNDRIIQV